MSSYLEIVRDLPEPSPKQIDQFLEDFPTLQLWHKLLPLETGTEFQFFLNPEIKNQVHSEKWLPSTNLTAKDHISRFGFLDYFISPSAQTNTIQPHPLAPAMEFENLAQKGISRLFPYISWDIRALDVLSAPLEGKKSIPNSINPKHPDYAQILVWEEKYQAMNAAFEAMDDATQDEALRFQDDPNWLTKVFPKKMRDYLRADYELAETYLKLQEKEMQKVENAVMEILDWVYGNDEL